MHDMQSTFASWGALSLLSMLCLKLSMYLHVTCDAPEPVGRAEQYL